MSVLACWLVSTYLSTINQQPEHSILDMAYYNSRESSLGSTHTPSTSRAWLAAAAGCYAAILAILLIYPSRFSTIPTTWVLLSTIQIRTYCLPTYQIDDDDQEEIRCDRVTSEREVCGIGRDTLLGIVKDVQKKGRWGA